MAQLQGDTAFQPLLPDERRVIRGIQLGELLPGNGHMAPAALCFRHAGQSFQQNIHTLIAAQDAEL